MDFVQSTNENIFILPDCCPTTKYLYYREGVLEMPLNCLTPCNNIVYKFKQIKLKDSKDVIVHPMYGHPNLKSDKYYGPTNDTFLHYLQLLKEVEIIDSNENCEMLHFPFKFNKQLFLNKRYSKIDGFDSSNTLNILVLHHEYYALASQFRNTLKRMGFTTFIMYVTEVTLAKLGNMQGDYIIFGCFNKTLLLLYGEISRFANLYTAWDIVYWINRDNKEIDFWTKYYLNPLDIPMDLFDIVVECNSQSTQIIKATSKYGTYAGLPVNSNQPISQIQKGRRGIASEYHEIQ